MPMLVSHVVRFGVFELDARSGEPRRHGLKARLPDQSFQILKVLLTRAGEAVSREELRHAVWTAQFKTIASESAHQTVMRQVGR